MTIKDAMLLILKYTPAESKDYLRTMAALKGLADGKAEFAQRRTITILNGLREDGFPGFPANVVDALCKLLPDEVQYYTEKLSIYVSPAQNAHLQALADKHTGGVKSKMMRKLIDEAPDAPEEKEKDTS